MEDGRLEDWKGRGGGVAPITWRAFSFNTCKKKLADIVMSMVNFIESC